MSAVLVRNVVSESKGSVSAQSVLEALAAANQRARGQRLSATRIYTIKLDGDAKAKLPPQAIACLKILFSLGKPSINEVELHAVFQEHEEISKVQEPWRIFKYYVKDLREAGFLTHTK